jgi:hypothetical protein
LMPYRGPATVFVVRTFTSEDCSRWTRIST